MERKRRKQIPLPRGDITNPIIGDIRRGNEIGSIQIRGIFVISHV